MKVSMSLPAEDLEFLDAYAQAEGYPSRSAVLHKAVRLLRAAELSSAYEEAWEEWSASGEAATWEVTVGDGANA
jgi:Arc/MetJ-type ribon-helix-helix transcriptional regulator